MMLPEEFTQTDVVKNLRRNGLNVGTVIQEPWVYACGFDPILKNRKDCNKGMAIELTDTFCNQLKIECRYFLQNFTDFSDFPYNNTNKAMSERIISGGYNETYGAAILDTAIPILVQTPYLRNYLNFTMPVFYMQLGAMIKTDWEHNDEFYFVLRPFHWSVWLMLCIAIFLVSCTEAYFLMASPKISIETKNKSVFGKVKKYFSFLSSSFVVMFAILMSRAMDTAVPQFYRRILMFTWGLICIVICNVYSGQLVSTKVALIQRKPFSNVQELAEKIANNEYQLIIFSPDSKFINDVMTDAKEPYLSLHQALKSHPPQYLQNITNFTNILTHSSDRGKLALFASQFTLRALAKGNCNVSIIPLGITDFGSFAFLPENNYVNLFSRVILSFKERGYYLDVLERKYNFGRDCESRKESQTTNGGQYVNLGSLIVVFWILFLGSTFATFAFSLEYVYRERKVKADEKIL